MKNDLSNNNIDMNYVVIETIYYDSIIRNNALMSNIISKTINDLNYIINFNIKMNKKLIIDKIEELVKELEKY